MAEITFKGEQFEVAESIGAMPLMRFAKVAKGGVDSGDLAALAALYDLLEQCIADEEWQRFQNHADKTRADGDDLFLVVKDVFEVLSGRPTQRPSDSSDGPSTESESSTVVSFGPQARLEQQGRPDLALILLQTQESRSA